MKKVTIKDVATEAGVSIATVSRVVNNNQTVEPQLREKVFAAIDKMGYVPNAQARSLKSASTSMIGYIVSDISNNYFTSLAYNMEEVVEREGYNIMLFSSNQKKDKELNYLKMLVSNNVAGIVINSSGYNDDYLAMLSQRIPIVSISRKIQNPTYAGDFVDSNNYDGGYKLTEHLIQKGHTRIGVVNGNKRLSTGLERFNGFYSAMSDAGLPIKDEYMVYGDFSTTTGYDGMQHLLSLASPPSAVITMNNSTALGAMQYLIDQRISVPKDVSMASYGDINNFNLLRIQPSYVSLNPRTIGTRCGELILDRIQNPQIQQREIIYEPKLYEGSGVASFNKGKKGL